MDKILVDIGLNPKEAKVYMCVLGMGRANISQIVEKTKLKRPTLYYDVLPSLLSQNLLAETISGKRKFLLANNLEGFFEYKKKKLEELEKILPNISEIISQKNAKPQILLYEGISGIKQVWSSHLREGKEIQEFVSIEKIHKELEKYVSNYYIRERVKRKIPVKMIVSKKEGEDFPVKNNLLEMREIKFIESGIVKIPLCLDIYGNNVSITLIREDSEPIGIIIKSKEISEFLSSIFNFAWAKI